METEPLTWRGLAVIVVGAGAELATELGVDVPSGLQTAIAGVVAAGALVYMVVSGRRKVTPLAEPRDSDGTRLVRADGRALKGS